MIKIALGGSLLPGLLHCTFSVLLLSWPTCVYFTRNPGNYCTACKSFSSKLSWLPNSKHATQLLACSLTSVGPVKAELVSTRPRSRLLLECSTPDLSGVYSARWVSSHKANFSFLTSPPSEGAPNLHVDAFGAVLFALTSKITSRYLTLILRVRVSSYAYLMMRATIFITALAICKVVVAFTSLPIKINSPPTIIYWGCDYPLLLSGGDGTVTRPRPCLSTGCPDRKLGRNDRPHQWIWHSRVPPIRRSGDPLHFR